MASQTEATSSDKMAEREQVHPITKKDLEAHLKKVDEHFELINRGHPSERESLFNVMRGIGSGNENLMAAEVQKTVDVLREGFSLYYEMNGLIEQRTKDIDGKVSSGEKQAFQNSYSSFAAGSLIAHELGLLIGNKEPFPLEKGKINFNFDLTKDDLLNSVLAVYFGLINLGKRKGTLETGEDVPRGSYNFFSLLREQALEKKETFNPALVDLVKNSQFRVKDEFTITGFEAGFEEKAKSEKIEFAPILPYQVAGNVLAKKEILRDMDRLALFDLHSKKNPILEVGGLSWSVLYDGLPGTGKSSLFRMGLTRLKQRCEQAGAYWKSKNHGDLQWSQIIIDQGVKDEFYGKTGKNLLEKLAPTKKPDAIYIITTDDIDLLVSGDRNSSSGGADKDILNILMQYADGINTVIRGNVQWWAATNDATSMDPALRQRFIARYSVDGPQEWYDFADILHNELRTWIKTGIVDLPLGKGYTPYEMRKGQTGNEEISGSSLISKVSGLLSGKGISMRDVGELSAEHKRKNEKFTGRAIHAVSEAIKKRINDYEIPEEWYEKPEAFFAQPYERRVEMLKELCVKVDGDVIIEEIERYATSETRYTTDKFESDVSRLIHNINVQAEAATRLKTKK
ncbi:AAA family ATPase [Candidatus Pacearchaeota archaeon]|nr:AAA family ATPase [Candidatus Pacearchaeota archaeon]